MRNLLTVLSFLLLVPVSSPAQDPGAQAAQQAAQQAQQDAQRAQQDAMNAANAANSAPYGPYFALTATPKFSIKPGAYSSPTKVKITDTTRGAIIYYTTDGWTPTPSSPRYMGPVTISSDTTLQAIAIAPNFQRSFVATGKYTLNNSNLPAPANPQTASAPPSIPPGEKLLLPQGTPVLLAFAADVSSHNASVGDQIPMTVTQDVQQDGVVLIKTGTPAVGTVIQVDKNTAFGLPGVLSFKVDYLDLNGTPIRLCGEAAREGEAKPPNAAILIPVVGPLTALRRGTDAVIKQGTPFTAFIYADISLAPVQ